MAAFCFIRPIGLHIYPQLFGPVCKLALLPIGTVAFVSKIFAERAFGFGGGVMERVGGDGGEGIVHGMFAFVRFSGGVGVGMRAYFVGSGADVGDVVMHMSLAN